MRKMRRPDAADYHAAVGKGNPTIFDDVDGPPWYYAQWKESLKKKKHNNRLINAERRLVVARGGAAERLKEVERYKLPGTR